MIRMAFVRGRDVMQIIIEKREVRMLSQLLGNKPLIINLDRLNDPHVQMRIKKANIDNKTLRELSKLLTEEDMAEDIQKDLQQTGWRLLDIKYDII